MAEPLWSLPHRVRFLTNKEGNHDERHFASQWIPKERIPEEEMQQLLPADLFEARQRPHLATVRVLGRWHLPKRRVGASPVSGQRLNTRRAVLMKHDRGGQVRIVVL